MFEAAGYFAAVELELRIDPDWEPKPDVAAALLLEEPYPTRPIEIVAEVLSPDDEPARTLAKCRNYHRIGTGRIYIFDPIKRTAWVWDAVADDLVSMYVMDLGNETVVPVARVWAALDRKMRRSSSPLL